MLPVSVQVLSIDKLVGKLKHQIYRAKTFNKSVIVGYSARYAIYVHEDMQKAPNSGQRKYLTEGERLARHEYTQYLVRGIRDVTSDRPFPMVELLLGCCTIIMNYSQPLVPVLTGYLKNSKFQHED
jgi:hypothetical protein